MPRRTATPPAVTAAAHPAPLATDAAATLDVDVGFGDLARLAALACGTPAALITVAGADGARVVAQVGLDLDGREPAFCALVREQRAPLVIADPGADDRLAGDPLASAFRLIAGAPVPGDDRRALGAVCVVDPDASALDERRLDGLTTIARQVAERLALHESRRAARRLAEERDAADRATRADRAERLQDDFVSTVSHELRTPLTSIRGSLGLIEGGVAGALPPQVLELARIARANADRLIRLINDILDLDKMEAGRLELRPVALHPSDVVTTVLEELQGIADERRIRLVARIGRHDRFIGDRDRVIQVLTNLVSNAIAFSPVDADVTVRVLPGAALTGERSHLRFVVEDTGPGIPPSQLGRLFRRFGMLDGARRRGGTGLGLAISKAIVEQHGGAIGVESEPHVSTRFWFELPLVAEPSAAATDARGPHTVLLVEDDADLAEVLTIFLRHEGYLVAHAASLDDARRMLRDLLPSVVLLDVVLPDGDGRTFIDEVRGDAALAEVPIVVLSATDAAVPPPGVLDWIAKPFDERRLFRALRIAVRAPGSPRVLLVGGDGTARTMLAARLAGLGADCLFAADGAAALDLARQETPDLIVLDPDAEDGDGAGLVRELRRGRTKTVPLIVYGERELTADERRTLTLGTTHHLVKGRASDADVFGLARELLGGLPAGTTRR